MQHLLASSGLFAQTGAEASSTSAPQPPAEVLFHILGVPVTNSIFTAWVVILLLVLFAYFSTRNMKLIPAGFLGLFFAGASSVPAIARMRARKTLYAITDRRALVWSCNFIGYVTLTVYTPKELQNMWRTSSWFMIAFIRSLARIVSKAKLSGAIWMRSESYGTLPADAFP